MIRSFSSDGVILKRLNYGEADRIVTIYTKDFGKITAMAKGVRKTVSRKKGGLEPGTISKCFFINGKGMPLITQASIITSHQKNQQNLVLVTQTLQMLEIVDALTIDDGENYRVYSLLTEALSNIANGISRQDLLASISDVVAALGFGPPASFTEYDLKEYIEDLTSKSLKTKLFLTTNTKSTVQ